MKRFTFYLLLICLLGFPWPSGAQTPPDAQDPAAVWKTLWQPAMDSSKSAHVTNVELIRDRVHIVLSDGTLQFTQPANGVIFGAVFRGSGHLTAVSPNPLEAQQLRLFTKQDNLNVPFTEATFSFSDSTFDEVAKQVKWTPGASGENLYAKRQEHRENLGAALVPRLFKSLFSANRSRRQLFFADFKSDHGWVELHFDASEPEQVQVGRWGDLGPVRIFDTWLSFPAGDVSSTQAFNDSAAKADFLIPNYHIDVAVTGGADLSATTRAEIHPRVAGERILLFTLDSNLRLESVKDSQGRALIFFQSREVKDRYQSYGDYVAVALPQPTQAGESIPLDFRYGGKRVVRKVGDGNYFCESFGWYPVLLSKSTGVETFANRANFEINFRSPKKYSLVATGNKVSETRDGDLLVTTWKSEAPLSVAGFAFGDYKLYEQREGDVNIQIFANRQPDDGMRAVQQFFDDPLPTLGGSHVTMGAVGQLTPAAMAKTMGTEMVNTVRVFQSYYGPYPYKQLAVTNIPYSYGQGWPGLIYLSAISFMDSTQRNTLGLKDQIWLTDFWRGHESSHQWWGHRVGWKSYHDQWLSEGFAEFSGQLYTQYRENMKEYFRLLRDNKTMLESSDINGRHFEQVGPVWMGQRLASSVSPRGYSEVIYKKGGYILHMIRMMLYDFRNPDHDHLFKDMMKDFCRTYDTKPASTEDFKTIVEKHMSHNMDLDRNRKMDWFFNQYVYGTGIPQYDFRYSATATPDGKFKISGTVTRAGVAENWQDMVPLYLHQGQNMIRVGFITAVSPVTPFEFLMPAKPDKLTINDFEDLLADVKQ